MIVRFVQDSSRSVVTLSLRKSFGFCMSKIARPCGCRIFYQGISGLLASSRSGCAPLVRRACSLANPTSRLFIATLLSMLSVSLVNGNSIESLDTFDMSAIGVACSDVELKEGGE